MKKKALFAGTFDPLTLGHMDIIVRASSIFDELTVAVVFNINKSSLFTICDRMKMIQEACKEIDNLNFAYVDGLLSDFVNKNDIDVVVRGLRDSRDFQYELEMAQYNSSLFEKAETLFLMTSPNFSYISSTGVREIIEFNGKIDELVPETVNSYIQKWRRENE